MMKISSCGIPVAVAAGSMALCGLPADLSNEFGLLAGEAGVPTASKDRCIEVGLSFVGF